MSLINNTFTAADAVDDGRSVTDILIHLTTEVGELAEEVQISQGKSYKPRGEDGIVGEAIDIILCALDIIHKTDPNMDELDIEIYAKMKLNKWVLSTRKDT